MRMLKTIINRISVLSPYKLQIIFSLSTLLFNSVTLSSQNTCHDACSSIEEDLQSRQEEIKRIQEIKEKNERFILSLDPDQYSQKIKADSNIRVADRRIFDLVKNSQEVKAKFDQEGCNQCQKSGG